MTARDTLKLILIENQTPWGRRLVLVIHSLILLSLISFSLETLPDLSDEARTVLFTLEVLTVSLFTVEYGLRIWLAERKWAFLTSFYGLIDLLAILPFYLSLGVDLRSLRVLRIFRLFRIFKLVRYSRAINRFHRALLIAWEELILFLLATLLLLYFSAVGIYYCENAAQPEQFASVFHSLWWSVITLTTVGYGDVYPITFGGRVFTFAILLIGLGVVSIPAGLLASALSKARELED